MQLSDFQRLADAKAYSETKERMLTQDMIVALLTEHNCVTTLEQSSDEKAKGFYLAIQSGVKEFNIMNSHPVGQRQQQLLSYIANTGAVNQAFADACVSEANFTHLPFAKSTEYDFMKAKGTCPVKQVTPQSGWLKITTTGDCEKHNPQIYAEVQGVRRRVAGFQSVEKAGDHLAKVPREHSTLYVDDAYGVIQ